MIFKGRPENTAQGVLARLWRNVIHDNKLENKLAYLVTIYVNKNSSDSKSLIRKTRSTLETDITANDMTWKKFTHLLFHYLLVVRLDITIKLSFANGTSSTHTVGIKSSDNMPKASIDTKVSDVLSGDNVEK